MQKFLRRRLIDGVSFVILIVLLGGFAEMLRINPALPSNANNLFILQAQAWLHGHLDIGTNHLWDAVTINGKVYIVFPPLPALLMVPFVAVLGNTFSDIWFTWMFGALNIVLMFRTLEVTRTRCITSRTVLENLIMAITFGFGTIALWLCLGGEVWFTAQTISIFGIMITLHSTLSRRWSLATLGVGMVLLTRTSEVLIGIVPLVVYLHDLGVGRYIQQRWHILPQHWPSIRELVVALVPLVVALLIFLARNKLYFNNLLSTGYDIQQQQNYPDVRYGLVSWHYIWPNFAVDFLSWPSISFINLFDVHPQVNLLMNGMGTNIFFSTPLLAIFLFAPQGKTSHVWLRHTFWVTVVLLLLPVLFYAYEGWGQVGARYLFPLYPLLFLLLAQRAAPLDIRWISLAGLSIFINLLLAKTFWEKEPGKIFAAASAGIVLIAWIIALIMLRRQEQKHIKITPLAPAIIPAESTNSKELITKQSVLS
jgi:hypothetical protein